MRRGLEGLLPGLRLVAHVPYEARSPAHRGEAVLRHHTQEGGFNQVSEVQIQGFFETPGRAHSRQTVWIAHSVVCHGHG